MALQSATMRPSVTEARSAEDSRVSLPHVVAPADYRRMPWKNGGGYTWEIAAESPGTDLASFAWRVSVAAVAARRTFLLVSRRRPHARAARRTRHAPVGCGHAGRARARRSSPLRLPAKPPSIARWSTARRATSTHGAARARVGAAPGRARRGEPLPPASAYVCLRQAVRASAFSPGFRRSRSPASTRLSSMPRSRPVRSTSIRRPRSSIALVAVIDRRAA